MIKQQDTNEIKAKRQINNCLNQLLKENEYLRNINRNERYKKTIKERALFHHFNISVNGKINADGAFIRREGMRIKNSKQRTHLKFENKNEYDEDNYTQHSFTNNNSRNKTKDIHRLECLNYHSHSSSSCSSSMISDAFNSTIIQLSRTMKSIDKVDNNHNACNVDQIPSSGTPSNKKLPLCYRTPVNQKEKKMIEFKH